MCGIAGIFYLNTQSVDRKILHRMDLALIHRGPDGHGHYLDQSVGLASRRLAIIDPTSAGNQPMTTDDGSLTITFNGEIFNYEEIRDNLISLGYKFHSHTDTETVLYGYKHFGEEIVTKLIGHFAFCIYDKKNCKLFLARDQLGVNPLYYSLRNKTFLFASEVKSVLASGLVPKDLDPQSIHHYLSMFVVPAPWTIFKAIKTLLPGHTMTVGKSGLKIKNYYAIPLGLWRQNKMKENELVDLIRRTLVDSVRSALVSDVPVGVFLSGGIDSSTIFAIMSSLMNKSVKTYSLWAEGGEAYDERKYIKQMLAKYPSNHNVFSVTQKDILQNLPRIVYHFDQPTGGSMEAYFISEMAGKDVKVALSGLGGDELFGGYNSIIYQSESLSNIYNRVPRGFRFLLVNILKNLVVDSNMKNLVDKGDKFLSLPGVLKKRLLLYIAFQDGEKNKLYDRNFLNSIKTTGTDEYFRGIFDKVQGQSPMDQLEYLDLNSYTRDDLLMGTNMMSMANSLEVRVPLLDPRLVKVAALCPPHLKYKSGISKYILKKAAVNWLPPEVIRHKKTGFGLPRITYMHNFLKPYIYSVLSKESIKKRAIFNYSYVSRCLSGFYGSRYKNKLWSEHLRVWLLFIFELWCRIYIDHDTVDVPGASLGDFLES